MTNPGFSIASGDPADHPEFTFLGASPQPFLPTGCPPLDPGQLARKEAVISSADDTPEVTPEPSGPFVVPDDHLADPVVVDPEEPPDA